MNTSLQRLLAMVGLAKVKRLEDQLRTELKKSERKSEDRPGKLALGDEESEML